MKPSLLKSFGVAALWLLAASQAGAQPNIVVRPSIESIVLNADVVVVGKIVDVEEEKEIYKLTVAVEETLKGPHEDRLLAEVYRVGGGMVRSEVFSSDRSNPRADIATLKEDAHRLLVAVEGKPRRVSAVIDFDDTGLKAFAADLTVLRKPDDVIRVAKEALRRAPGVKRIGTFRLSTPSLGNYTFLQVPVNERLEKRALAYVRSKDSWQRAVGMDALQHFKSDENIELMKGLLNDPEWVVGYGQTAEENLGIEVRYYGMREKAYRNLTSWDVKVAEPVTSVKVEKLDAVRKVILAADKVTVAALKDLGRFKNLEELDLFDVDRLTEAEVKALAGFKNLNLHLGASVAEGAKVTDDSLLKLGALTNLHEVDLGATGVTDIGLKALAGQSKLEFLDLNQTRITDAALAELSGCSNLRTLELRGTKVTAAGLTSLKHLSRITTLALESDTDATLRTLHEMGMLHVLDTAEAERPADYQAYQNSPRPKSEQEVAVLHLSGLVTDVGLQELMDLKNLKELNLGDGVTDAGLKELARLPKLERVSLGSTKITDAGLKELARLPNLKRLLLYSPEITDAGMKEVGGYANLVELSVGGTPVTHAGLKELKGLNKLTTLSLRPEQLTDATVRTLREMNMLHVLSNANGKEPEKGDSPSQFSPRAKSDQEIVSLELWGAPLTDAGLQELTGLKNLVKLNLERTKVTDDGVARLHKALPKCKITR